MRKELLMFALATLLIASRAEAGNCSFTIAPPNMVFGIYSAFGGGSVAAVSNYEIRCTPNTTGMLTLTTGANSSSYLPRYMANGANLIGYNIYSDAANSTIFGDGSGGTTTQVVLNATPQSKDFPGTLYGAAPQGADVPPGVYTDTVTAVLTWDGGARSTSVSFTITTTVQAECTVTAVPVNFGNYNPVGTHAVSPLDGTGGINVYCTVGTVGTVSLGPGQNFSATRRMAGPAGSFLNYQLYREAARSTIWSTTPNTVAGTSTSRFIPLAGGMVVYGRVPAGQDPRVGVHNDIVQATVNY